MSVKSFVDDRWTSTNDGYSVYWELDEIDLTADTVEPEKEIEKKSDNKEEIVAEAENILDDDDVEISSDFTIEEILRIVKEKKELNLQENIK